MNNIERMKKGLLYNPLDKDIFSEQYEYVKMLHDYNRLDPRDFVSKNIMLKKMFKAFGDESFIEQPFYANFGGKHVSIGHHSYANFNLTLVDDGNIYIGDYVMIGPNVTIITAGHPIDKDLRQKGLQFNKNVFIGNNVWLGANVTVLPGVKIGDNTVIGACSLVTSDIPENVVAYGSPCKVIRKVGEKDKMFFFKDQLIDYENILKY